MTSAVAKFVFGKVLKESAANKFGKQDDPYFDYPATEMGRAGKKKPKRRKKALPPGLTDEEAAVLAKVKRRAYRLDMSFGSFLGLRFGWSSIIGIVPFIGDVGDGLLALLVLKTCMALSLPSSLLIHMLINIAFDFLIGLIPIIGDLADAGYKCNTRNAILLEKHLRDVGKKRLKAQGVTNAEDPSLPGYESPNETADEIDLESQVPALERARSKRSRRDDRYVGQESGTTEPPMTHTKSLRKNRK